MTIVTNSAFIAGYAGRGLGTEFILLGGVYQKDSQVMVGPLVKQCAGSFCVDRLFLGADGWSPSAGFANSDHLRAQAVRDMAAQAEAVAVLTESEKFSRRSVAPLQLGDKLKTVITDGDIPGAAAETLRELGVQVIEVPARETGGAASKPEKLTH